MGIDEELAGPEYMARQNLIRRGWIELSDGALLPPERAEGESLKARDVEIVRLESENGALSDLHSRQAGEIHKLSVERDRLLAENAGMKTALVLVEAMESDVYRLQEENERLRKLLKKEGE